MDERYYTPCPLRKNRAQIAITVCQKKQCIWLTTEDGKMKCGYGDPNASLGKRPAVNKISRDGAI